MEADTAADETLAPERQAAPRTVSVLPGTAALFAASAALAAYTGFRIPNLWAVTLQAVSLQDGFHRRVLVGTILQPLAAAFDYDYWFYAGVSFTVLAAIFGILGVAILRTPLASRRVLILAWLLLPTGGFLFNEVGYLDQYLYLALFAALWLRHRSRPVAATVVMTAAPFIHEIAALTVLPIFALAVLSTEPFRRGVKLLVPPAAAALTVLAIHPAAADAADRSRARLRNAGFIPRWDVYTIYQRTTTQNWSQYSIHEVLVYVIPVAALMVAGFVLLHRAEAPADDATWIYPLLACLAIAAPILLSFAGWDAERWGFLAVTNFFVVAWLWLGRPGRPLGLELKPVQWAVLLVLVLVTAHMQFSYFDDVSPRILGWHPFVSFLDEIRTGSLFKIPKM